MTETIQKLIVNRDGYLDQDWISQLESMHRREAVKAAGQTILNKLTGLPNRLGEISLNLLTIIEENRI